MSARRAKFYEQSRMALREDTIPEIQRRLVAIHAALAEATDDDRDIRGWCAQQLMQLMDDVDDAIMAREKAKA